MRLMEGVRLRVKDVDFDRNAIIVREAKGNKDRVVMLPQALVPALQQQVLLARSQWEADRLVQRGGVKTPHSPATSGYRHSYRTRAVRPQRCKHHHDLHPCAQSRCGRHRITLGHSFAYVMPSRPQMALSDIISDTFSAVAQVFPA